MNGGVAAKVRLAQMASTEEEEDETDDYSEEEFASPILGQDHPTVNCVERRLGSLGEIIDSNPGRLPQLSREQPMRQATGGAAQFILVSNLKQVFLVQIILYIKLYLLYSTSLKNMFTSFNCNI